MAGIDRFAQWLGMIWAGFVIGVAVLNHGDVAGSAAILVAVATVTAVLAALYAVVALEGGHRLAAGLALVLAAISAPMYAAEAVNVVPLLAGLALIRAGHREQARALAGSPPHGALHRH